MRCALVALAEILDQFNGIEHYPSTAVGLRLQKLWITLAKSRVVTALEERFGRPDGVKLALEWRFGRLLWPSWPWNAVLICPTAPN